MRRVTPPRGLTYFDANMGCLITEGPDVCGYKSQLRELDPNLSAYYDKVQEEWIVTFWDEKNNQDKFLLSDKDLGRAYEKVLRARNDRPGALTADELDRKLAAEQKQAQEEDMDDFRDIAADAAERLAHAFKKDGLHDHEDIHGVKPRKHLVHRDVRIRV